jgi:hypothetical protein
VAEIDPEEELVMPPPKLPEKSTEIAPIEPAFEMPPAKVDAFISIARFPGLILL